MRREARAKRNFLNKSNEGVPRRTYLIVSVGGIREEDRDPGSCVQFLASGGEGVGAKGLALSLGDGPRRRGKYGNVVHAIKRPAVVVVLLECPQASSVMRP